MSEQSENSDKKEEKIESVSFIYEQENVPKFENVFGEVEFFKKKCEILEKDLFKTQTQIKKCDATIKKLQEMVQTYGKNTNNTSNSFLLPSEFKINWENLVKDSIMEAFENIFDNNVLLSHLVQDTVKIVYDEANQLIKNKIFMILNSININDPNENTEKFLIKFRLLFQEYFTIVFNCTEEFYNKILNSLGIQVKKYNKDIVEGREKDINEDLISKGLKIFINSTFKLCIYMLLHDPQLSINIQSYDVRTLYYYFYNKSDYLNIEGFGKDKSPCLLILPSPLLRSNFPYQGIKRAVYIVQNVNENILKECEKNVQISPKIRSYSSNDFNIDKVSISGSNLLNKNMLLSPLKEKSNIHNIHNIHNNPNNSLGSRNYINNAPNPNLKNNNAIADPSGNHNPSDKNSIPSNIKEEIVTLTSSLNSSKSSPKYTKCANKPNSADFGQNSFKSKILLNINNENNENPNNQNKNKFNIRNNNNQANSVVLNAFNAFNAQHGHQVPHVYHAPQRSHGSLGHSTNNLNSFNNFVQQHTIDKNNKQDNNSNVMLANAKKSYDQPLSLNNFNISAGNRNLKKSSFPLKTDESPECYDIKSPTRKENTINEIKNYRSNSHSNMKNPSRNSSNMDSFNNSINKDSLRTNEGMHLKTSRTPVEINSELESVRKREVSGNEKTSSISNSFTLLRAKSINYGNTSNNLDKINIDNPTIGNCGSGNNTNGTSTPNTGLKLIKLDKDPKSHTENLIRLNLSKDGKKYNLNTFTNNVFKEPEISKEKNINFNYPLNKKTASNLINHKNINAMSTGNYLKNINNNININNMMLKTNYEFGNISRKKSNYK